MSNILLPVFEGACNATYGDKRRIKMPSGYMLEFNRAIAEDVNFKLVPQMDPKRIEIRPESILDSREQHLSDTYGFNIYGLKFDKRGFFCLSKEQESFLQLERNDEIRFLTGRSLNYLEMYKLDERSIF